MQHGLARIGCVLDAGQACDRGRGPARLMGGEATELDGGDDGVARRPRALAALDARVVTREDEALLVGRQPLERRADQPRDGVDTLGLDALATGLELEAVLVAQADDAGH